MSLIFNHIAAKISGHGIHWHWVIIYLSQDRKTCSGLIFICRIRARGTESEGVMRKYLLLLVVMVMMAEPANADLYTWEDEARVLHITDYPPPQNLKKQKIKYFEESMTKAEPSSAKKEKKPDIVLYTKNDCPECDKARNFLNSKELVFTEYNMDEDKTAVEKRKGIDDGADVPFAVINRNQVYGFSEAVYNRALKP